MFEARTFKAKFSGPCQAGCGEHIHAGDEVKWADGRVIHAGCELIEVDTLKPGQVCLKCFTEVAVNGTCACDA